jgi:hypothetical protein
MCSIKGIRSSSRTARVLVGASCICGGIASSSQLINEVWSSEEAVLRRSILLIISQCLGLLHWGSSGFRSGRPLGFGWVLRFFLLPVCAWWARPRRVVSWFVPFLEAFARRFFGIIVDFATIARSCAIVVKTCG